MKIPLPNRKLPERPDLNQLRRQAKDLLDAYLADEAAAAAQVNLYYHDADPNSFALHDAQLVIARSYGYESWPKLKAFVDGITVKRLIDAVRSNDSEQVRSILRIRPELINAGEAWNNEHTALHCAVLRRMPEMVRLLMDLGAEARQGINPHVDATSALTIATERGYDEIVDIIEGVQRRRAQEPAGVDDFPHELRSAIQQGEEDGAIDILERRQDLVKVAHPYDRRTLLHAASAFLLHKLAAWLLDHGAEVNRPSKDGTTPLDMVGRYNAAERSTRVPEMAQLLMQHGAAMTPRAAVILGDTAFLEKHRNELLQPQDSDGWLLGLATAYNRPDILKFLLDLGLDPDARQRVQDVDEVAFTWGMPLYECARHGKHAMAEMLLEHGADPNGQVYASGTPLSEAYGQRDERMIALLERYGGESNPSMAGLYRRMDLAKKLLARYGNASLPDDGFGAGPVAEQLVAGAARGGDVEIVKLALPLIDKPAGDPFWYGALVGPLGFWNHWIGPWCHHEWDRSTYLTCFKMILERCGPPTRQLRFDATILHEIVTMRDHVTPEERVAFGEAALDAGARLDLRDGLLKSTPLGWACRWGREEMARLFLARGADPVEADAEPWATPRAWAEKKGHESISRLLGNLRGT